MVVEAPRPCVASVTNANDNVHVCPRLRTSDGQPEAHHGLWAGELGLGAAEVGDEANRLEVLDTVHPRSQSECEFIEGEDGAEKGANLARKLVERKVI